ncbi:MAG TPA: hypothetical protein VK459_14420 [Polyangiaceae bacterium]|nr:hypothetical protein [Polyangiaceae bacterium]
MTQPRRVSAVGIVFFGGFLVLASCDDEDRIFETTAATSSGGNGAGGTGSTGGAGGTGDTGGAGGTTGGAGGQGGNGQAGGGGSGGIGPCDVPDKDMDGASDIACGGTDCDDSDSSVFAAQTNFFDKARANGSFDYNCNNIEEREFETIKCAGVACMTKVNVFLGDPSKPEPCGTMANFGDCNGFCQASNLTTKPMRCR